jgi:hypothetical protein
MGCVSWFWHCDGAILVVSSGYRARLRYHGFVELRISIDRSMQVRICTSFCHNFDYTIDVRA